MHEEIATKPSLGRHQQRLNFLMPLASLIVAVGVGMIIHYDQRGMIPALDNLRNLDAGYYDDIRTDGYHFDPDHANNTAFFPLFPFLWRFLHVGLIGISITNGLVFIAGTYMLMQHFPAGWRTRLMYLGLSMLVFFVAPYSESFFYFFAVLLLCGLKRQQHWLVIIGILGAGLTRSVGTVFAPAFLLIGLYYWYHTGNFRKAIPYMWYMVAGILSPLIVFTIQWYQTGEFFAFTQTQKHWDIKWQWPRPLPFISWGPYDIQLYDQLALFLCLLCIVSCLVWLGARLWVKKSAAVKPYILLTLFYFSGIALLMLFTKGGNFNSINRYVFATPFLFIFLREVESTTFRWWHIIATVLLGVAYFMICWQMHNSVFLAMNAGGLLLFSMLLPVLLQQKNKAVTALSIVLSLTFLYLQAQLWFRYMTDDWVG